MVRSLYPPDHAPHVPHPYCRLLGGKRKVEVPLVFPETIGLAFRFSNEKRRLPVGFSPICNNNTLGSKMYPGANNSKDEMKAFIDVAAQRIPGRDCRQVYSVP